ncbi:MAG: manganese transport protein [Eubacteriales bacterium]|nr:manganese transport protein [Eubacteriales bacterium]
MQELVRDAGREGRAMPPGLGGVRSRLYTRFKIGKLLEALGPAFVVSVAYMDPGNFATNIEGGARFGSALLWVILWSNLAAIYLQSLSAKVGIASGRNLPALCRENFPPAVNYFLWAVAEIAAMATDLAEFLGAALGFHLLFHLPLLPAAFLTAAITFFLVSLEKYGQKVVERAIAALVGVICLSYLVEIFLARPGVREIVTGTLVPTLPAGSLYLVAGIVGATVMPHVVYLHSELVQQRRPAALEERQRYYRLEKMDILIAMNTAFLINGAMLVVAAAVFHSRGIEVLSIDEAHRTLKPLLGALSSNAFAVALLASGLSSSAVGTMAGQVIMSGFTGWNIPPFWRRFITMLPALVVIGTGLDPVKILILSQIVLSFALPGAIIPLLYFAGCRRIMGEMTVSPPVHLMGWGIAFLIIAMNFFLLLQTSGVF